MSNFKNVCINFVIYVTLVLATINYCYDIRNLTEEFSLVKYERRNTERYELPGARVQYRLQGGQSAETPVKDITHGGLCFEFSHSADTGHQIEIELSIPGKENLVLKGSIVWTSVSPASDMNYAAMQFLPFGTDDRYNTMENHKRLKNLLQECLDKNPPNIKFRL